jgi:hypothetical protein
MYSGKYRVGSTALPVNGKISNDKLKTNVKHGHLVGLWPMEGNGKDLTYHPKQSGSVGQDAGGHGLHLTVQNAHFVSGLYGQAFRIDEHSALDVTKTNPVLDAPFVSMVACE